MALAGLVSLLLCRAASAQQPAASAQQPGATGQQRFEETVVVTGTAAPAPLSEVPRSLCVVSRAWIAALPVRSVADALRLGHGLDVSSRGDGAVQSDFSLRGAGFGQTLVLVDGVRLNDSQTGHHNGDIPVPLEDVERIEVLEGPGSSLYGADAFGGVVQVITRQDGARLAGHLMGGSFGYGDAGLSGRTKHDAFSAALSLSAQRSDGFVADRDFRLLQARGRVSVGRNTRLALSHLDKDFGALGFYGAAPSREATRQSLASFERSFSAGERLAGDVVAFARAHGDHFVYDRRDPSLSDNRHESRSLGLALRLHRSLGRFGRLSAGAEAGGDWIDSTTLGERGFGRGSVFTEMEARVGRLAARPGLRFDAYGRFGSALSPSLAVGGPLRPGIRWRASAGRGFRVPTFTELYYHDPNHEASPDLRPESAWGADAGLDVDLAAGASAGVTAFGRREANVIDWVRPSAAERWRTENVHDVRAHGVETSARGRRGPAEIQLRHTWLETSAPALPLQSKYVLDFARHAFGCDLRATLPARLRLAPSLEYRRKVDGRAWWLLDVRLTRAVGRVELYVDGRNLADAHYQEIRGVDMPGRSLAAGVRSSVR